jgi:YggT family protein
MIPLALSRGDLAAYVNALFIVYIALILCNVLIGYVPRMPYRPWLRSLLDFITDSTNPYLRFVGRFVRPIGMGGVAIGLAPIVAILLLLVAQKVAVALLAG